MAFQGHYMHVEEPCAGLKDYIRMEATIEDEFLHEKFNELYGIPSINDYDRIAILEAELLAKTSLLQTQVRLLGNPLVKFTLKIIKFLAPKKHTLD